MTRLLAGIVALIACILGGYMYGHHEGTLAGAATLSQYKTAQAQANAAAWNAGQQAQQQADAATLAQQQKALADAQSAATAREAVVTAQAARVQSLQSALRAIPSTDQSAVTWLGPLPVSIQQALNVPGDVP
jgi:disulfide bond formation protein DsbB